jgi:hypothetical protein
VNVYYGGPVGEDATKEPLAVPLVRLRDARDVREVDAQAQDVHVRAYLRGIAGLKRAQSKGHAPEPTGARRRLRVDPCAVGSVLRCRALLPFADHLFTDASLSLGPDDREEWSAVAREAHVSPDRLLLLRQVHGTAVVVADGSHRGTSPRPVADAIVGRDPASALVVRVADCAPILIADRRTGAVASKRSRNTAWQWS